jgi:hypothetical protein
MRAHSAASRGEAVVLAVVVAVSLAAVAGVAAAGAARSPNDIDFMGTKTEGGRRCEVFQPPLKGRYCPAGAATFRAHGDTLFVCDYKADGRSVAVVARYRGRRRWHTTAVNYWGTKAFNGCRTQDRNFRENRSVQFRVCLARFAKPGGRRIDILASTCGAISESFNAS